MLRQFFNISTSWFEKSATITYPSNRFLTNYAENILNEIIKVEFTCEKLNETLHFKKSDTEFGCYIGHDLGIPCPYTIRLIRYNEIKNKNDNENFNLLEMPLFNNEKLIKFISPEWRISIMKKAFSPLINRQNTEFKIIPFKQDDILNDEKLDILEAKIRWLYSNSLVYKGKVDKLLKEAQEEIVFPFFEIKKPKEKKQKETHEFFRNT
ncbi:hypothetical protein M9Y10_045085 [Tritrichomonas musculus]|uniref:Uncharacterized protein n=1 Tax=Tritrichomonas musculus TaxID=1915356 RepID=A0ABR2JUG8_9EUKA